MKRVCIIFQLFFVVQLLTSFSIQKEESCSLTIEVKDLRNSKGVVQFALYDKDGSFPDEKFKKCIMKLKGQIVNGSSVVTFKNLPPGEYAVNVLHDEDNDGKIDKGVILPIEGIGFSNYQTIGLTNRPTFKKASFYLDTNLEIMVKIIYL